MSKWLSMGVMIPLAAVFIFMMRKHFGSLVFLTGIMLGQEIRLRFNKISCLIVFAFFTRSLYENTITSDVMVPPEPKIYATLREMIPDNVKVLVHRTCLGDLSFADKAAAEFRKNGIENMLNQSYEITSADDSEDDETVKKC